MPELANSSKFSRIRTQSLVAMTPMRKSLGGLSGEPSECSVWYLRVQGAEFGVQGPRLRLRGFVCRV